MIFTDILLELVHAAFGGYFDRDRFFRPALERSFDLGEDLIRNHLTVFLTFRFRGRRGISTHDCMGRSHNGQA